MRNLIITTLLCALSLSGSAQKITRSYRGESLSRVLEDLGRSTNRFTINFIYNELEDFTVTKTLHDVDVTDAVRAVCGLYPMKLTFADDRIFVECTQKAALHYKGRLVDETRQPVAAANVMLLSAQDSAFLAGGVSNAGGDFVIPCSARKVILRISYLGYKTVSRTVNTPDVGTIQLRPDAYTVKGVVVKGHLKTDYLDHSDYTFTDEQMKNARQTQDILTTLPGLYIDAESGKLRNMMGKEMKILLNGVETSDNELKNIPTEKVKKVEYYTVPPARYASVGLLINVVTRRLDNGYAVGADVTEAATTGFGNNSVYYRYNQGYHQLSIDYSNNIRNYQNRYSEQHYTFTQDDGSEADYLYGNHDHFGYTVNDLHLKYAYSKPDDLTFQLTLAPHFLHWFSRGTSTITANNNPNWQNGAGRNNNWTNTFGPSVDLYLDKTLPHGQTLAVNVVGTYYHNRQQERNEQWTTEGDSTLIEDNMQSHNNKYSLITELSYEKKWDNNTLSMGYDGHLSKSDYTISNLYSGYQPYDYSSSTALHRLYVEYQRTMGKFGVGVGMIGWHVHLANDDTHFNKLYVSPKLLMTYNREHSSLKFTFGMGMNVPAIARLSNNTTVVIPGLLSKGNPNLKAGAEYDAVLSYNYNCPWVDGTLYLQAIYTDKPENSYYQWKTIGERRVIVSSYENASYLWQRGGAYQLRFKPFKSEVFTIGVAGYVLQSYLSSSIIGKHSYWYTPVMYELSFRKGCWGASYEGNIVSKSLDGMELNSDENQSHLSAFYQKGAWRFTASCLWLFTKSKYSGHTVDNAVMNEANRTWIDDNKSMVALGVSWNFFSGKHKNIQKSLSNQDGDSGAF